MVIIASIVVYHLLLIFIMLATKNRKQVLIAFDQMLNARFGGWADETFSARCWRNRNIRKYAALVVIVDGIFFWQNQHCFNSYINEKERKQLPNEYQ